MVTCYYRHGEAGADGPIQSINSGICGGSGSEAGFFSCCFSWSTCLPNALCFDANEEPGYYTAQCTDPTLQDSACTKSCNDQPSDQVIYNSTSNLWQCCGTDDCSTPSDETFHAPSPNVLLSETQTILLFIPTSTSTSSTVSATSTPSTTRTASSSITTSPSSSQTTAATGKGSSLSVGAGVGIGIAATAVVVIAVLAAFLLLRKGKQRKVARDGDQEPQFPELGTRASEKLGITGNAANQRQLNELEHTYRAHELPVGGQDRL